MVDLGSTWGQPGVNLGSTWGQPVGNLGSTWGQPGVNLGPTCTALPRVLVSMLPPHRATTTFMPSSSGSLPAPKARYQ